MAASKAQRAVTAKRRTDAIKLKLAGLGWQEIADQLGYASRGAACGDVTRAMEKNLAAEAQAVEVYRQTELDRLDRLQAAHWTAATSAQIVRDPLTGAPIIIDGKPLLGPPSAQHAELVRKCVMDRVKIRGLAAPTKHELLTLDAIDAQIKALAEELAGTD